MTLRACEFSSECVVLGSFYEVGVSVTRLQILHAGCIQDGDGRAGDGDITALGALFLEIGSTSTGEQKRMMFPEMPASCVNSCSILLQELLSRFNLNHEILEQVLEACLHVFNAELLTCL